MGKHRLSPQTMLRRYQHRSTLYLDAIGEDGVLEDIGDFSSEAEANDWIVHRSASFFKARVR
jgi:hypothetical protein